VYPRVTTAKVGEDVSFMCCTRMTVLWYFDMEKLPKNTRTTVTELLEYSRLTIYNVQLNNTGKYVCRGIALKKLIFQEFGALKVFSVNIQGIYIYC